jgi:hypothetical protein
MRLQVTVLLMTYQLAYPYDVVRSNHLPRSGLRLGKKIPCRTIWVLTSSGHLCE